MADVKVPTIARSHRVFLVGTTGSGKTEIVKSYLRAETSRQIVIVDWKHDLHGVGGVEPCYSVEQFETRLKRDRIILYRPSKTAIADRTNNGDIARVMALIWEHCPAGGRGLDLWIDEGRGITTENQCPDDLNAMYVQGRTRNIRVWTLSQRPKRVWPMMRSEADHIIVMAQRLGPDDAKALADEMGITAAELNAKLDLLAERHRTSSDPDLDTGHHSYLHWSRKGRGMIGRPPLPDHARKPWPNEAERQRLVDERRRAA
jgi:hypothetical protein